MSRDQIVYMFNNQNDTITEYEKKINNLHIALNKANKRRKAQAEEISRLLANKQAVSDLKDKYDGLNKELLEHKAIIKYLEGKLRGER